MEVHSTPASAYRSKRGRISRACHRCHVRKVRCDGLQPTCSNCARAQAVCATTDNEKSELGSISRRRVYVERSSPDPSINDTPGANLQTYQPLAQPNESRQRQSSYVSTPRLNRRHPNTNISQTVVHDASPTQQVTPASGVSDFHTFTADMGMAVNVDGANIRRQHMGSSSLQVMTKWLSITFAAYGVPQSFSSQFQHGMRPAVEMHLPMTTQMPSLPSSQEVQAIASIYLHTSGSILPVFDKDDVSTLLSLLPSFRDVLQLDAMHRPLLASLYALLSIGYDEKAGLPSDQGTTYLQAGYSMMAHIIATPYLSSVQALLLITIALMGRNKEGAGWYTLGQAIRIAYSLGLHRRRPISDRAVDPQSEMIRRVWWTAYCLERIMVFETGRPTMIVDDQVDQDPPSEPHDQFSTLTSLVGLARIQGEISSRLYGAPHTAHEPSSYFQAMAEIIGKLTSWLRSQPEQIRPDQQPLCCGSDLILFATYLGFQYHQTTITLYRPALLFDTKLYEEQLNSVRLENNIKHRLRAGESICVNSARAIVTLLSDSLQQNCTTRLFTLTQPLLATYVLAIQLIKHPLAWSSASDLELMASSSKQITDLYLASGQTPGFCAMLQDLRRLSEQSVRYAAAASSHATTPARVLSPNPLGSRLDQNFAVSASALSSHESENRQTGDMNTSMANFELYQSLPFFFDHDLQNDDLRAADACHLFGLPIVGDDFGVLEDMT